MSDTIITKHFERCICHAAETLGEASWSAAATIFVLPHGGYNLAMDHPSRNSQGEGLQKRRGNIGAVWRNILWPVHPQNAHLADLVCSERHMFGPFSIHSYRCLSGFSEISRFLGLWTKNVNRCIYSNRRQDNLLKKSCTLSSRAGKRSKTQCQCFSKDWAFYQDITGGLWFIYT